MAQQKRYKLLIWSYLHNHLHKSIHAAHSMEVELTRKTEVSEWIDENDESIAKAYLIDRVKDTRETVIERNKIEYYERLQKSIAGWVKKVEQCSRRREGLH